LKEDRHKEVHTYKQNQTVQSQRQQEYLENGKRETTHIQEGKQYDEQLTPHRK